MDKQITVRLPKDLAQALQSASKRMNRKSSEVIRMALREYLFGGRASPPQRAYERVKPLIGALSSGTPDLAERRREYVLESIRRGR